MLNLLRPVNRVDATFPAAEPDPALEIDGKIVLIFSKDGLNDTGKVGGNCCCCGGNEIKNARQINVNLLAYTLTH